MTGSTSGIGRGIAGHFASIGASVMIHGPDDAEAQRIADYLAAYEERRRLSEELAGE